MCLPEPDSQVRAPMTINPPLSSLLVFPTWSNILRIHLNTLSCFLLTHINDILKFLYSLFSSGPGYVLPHSDSAETQFWFSTRWKWEMMGCMSKRIGITWQVICLRLDMKHGLLASHRWEEEKGLLCIREIYGFKLLRFIHWNFTVPRFHYFSISSSTDIKILLKLCIQSLMEFCHTCNYVLGPIITKTCPEIIGDQNLSKAVLEIFWFSQHTFYWQLASKSSDEVNRSQLSPHYNL